jgi:hypothetical protein
MVPVLKPDALMCLAISQQRLQVEKKALKMASLLSDLALRVDLCISKFLACPKSLKESSSSFDFTIRQIQIENPKTHLLAEWLAVYETMIEFFEELNEGNFSVNPIIIESIQRSLEKLKKSAALIEQL